MTRYAPFTRWLHFIKLRKDPEPKLLKRICMQFPLENKSVKIQTNTLLAKKDPEIVVTVM